MGILEQQLFISDKVITNDITKNRSARSLPYRNGYYLNHMYPANRPQWPGQSLLVGSDDIKMYTSWVEGRKEQTGMEVDLVSETIAKSKTAAKLG